MRIGACQTAEILGNIPAAVACMEAFARQPGADALDHLQRHALDLSSIPFRNLLDRLSAIRPTLVFGVIEQNGSSFFNTAVVVSQGRLECVYRKTHLVPGERLFQAGDTYPTFTIDGVTCGINICYDTRFPQAARAVAQVLLVPSQNMMKRQAAESWKHRHHAIRADRARETGMWLVSSDVTGARNGLRIGYGPTSVMNPEGEVAQVPTMTEGMVTAKIRRPSK